MVKGRGMTESAIDSGMIGSNDNRNEASELRCFTANAMLIEANVFLMTVAELE